MHGELRVCKPFGVGATVNQNSKWKFQMTTLPVNTAWSRNTLESNESDWWLDFRWARSKCSSGVLYTQILSTPSRHSADPLEFHLIITCSWTALRLLSWLIVHFENGWYKTPPIKGLLAFSRVYAGWAFSQDFFREQEYRKLGMASMEDTGRFLKGYFRQRDANDLLAMLWTWQHADISANAVRNGDFAAALRAIRSRAIVMPCDTDLYFRVRDNELEVEHMPNAELRPIPSIWGHAAGLGINQPDNKFIDATLNELLA